MDFLTIRMLDFSKPFIASPPLRKGGDELQRTEGFIVTPSLTHHFSLHPGIQLVPASGIRAIAAASSVSATRSSRSRWCTFDLPQARAIVVSSMFIVFT